MVFVALLTCSFFFQIKTNAFVSSNRFLKMGIMDDYNVIYKLKYKIPFDNYNNIIQDVLHKKVDRIYIDNSYKEIISVDNSPIGSLFDHYHSAVINPIIVPNLIEKAADVNVPIYFADFNNNIFSFQNVLNVLNIFGNYVVPFFIFLSFLSFFNMSNRNMSNNMMNMPMNQQRQQRRTRKNLFGFVEKEENNIFEKQNITIGSWCGSPEVLEECTEVISYIKNKDKFKEIGAEMPRGILLEGPPGTGKTLLAKAIASETNSTFISISASEFVEIFVGMGASRVRELFDNARKNKPSIIFIDEIDAVGRQRGAGINMANDEREQTLNQLLYEMDGFNDNEDIIIIAATNRKDVLDQALLRPGRFDRIIKVPLPDESSREKILSHYLEKKITKKSFDSQLIAELTTGFSGAQLKNLVNEAAILSARNNYTSIQEKYVFEAFEKLIVGLIKKNANTTPATKLRVSLHEAGHALLALKFNNYFDFQKVSIQPTYNGAGGYTIFSEKGDIKESGLYTKDLFKKRLIITMGGKAAESIYYGDDYVSLGAIQDLSQANSLAKRMIGNFGMGDKLEVFYNEDINDDSNPFLGRSLSVGDRYSQYTKTMMDKESLELVKEAYIEAKKYLTLNRIKLIQFSELLQQNNVLYKKDLNDFL